MLFQPFPGIFGIDPLLPEPEPAPEPEVKSGLTLGDVIGWFVERRKSKINFPPPPTPIQYSDDCDHHFSKWRDVVGQTYNSIRTEADGEKSVIGTFNIQTRECHTCGVKENRKYGWGNYE